MLSSKLILTGSKLVSCPTQTITDLLLNELLMLNYCFIKHTFVVIIINFLLKNCSYIFIYTDFDGNIPLGEAILGNHESVTKLLVENGADISLADVGRLACYAVEKKDIELLNDIAQYGGDVKKSSNGTTALHLAVGQGNVEMVKFLVEQGAYIDLQDSFGWSARAYADHQCHEEIQNIFKEIEKDDKVPHVISPVPNNNEGSCIEKCQSESYLPTIPQSGSLPPNQELTWLDNHHGRVTPFRNSFFRMVSAPSQGNKSILCRYLPSSKFK